MKRKIILPIHPSSLLLFLLFRWAVRLPGKSVTLRLHSRNNFRGELFLWTSLRVAGKHLCPAGPVKRNYVVWLWRGAINFHPRRANWHAGHSQTHNIGAFSDQTLNFRNRHMSLNNVAIYNGRMARLEFYRNLVLAFYRRQILYIFYPHGVTVLFQVSAPIATATSGW